MDSLVYNHPIMGFLSDCDLFRKIDWKTLELLAKAATVTDYQRGQRVYYCGPAVDLGLFLVQTGQVKLSILAMNGSERVIDVLLPRHSFGEASLFSGQCNKLSAEMLSDGKIVEIPREALTVAIYQSPELAIDLLRNMGLKISWLIDDVEKCCLRSANQRVRGYLRLLAIEQLDEDQSHSTIRLPASKGVVASLLDLTPETFSRELKRLAEMGVIEVRHTQIKILDPGAIHNSVF